MINAATNVLDVLDQNTAIPVEPTEATLDKMVSVIERQAESVSIATEGDYRNAGAFAQTIKRAQKKVEDYWEPMRVSTKLAYDGVLTHKKAMLDPLKAAEKILKQKMSDFYIEQKRRKEEEEELLRRAAQAEADRKLNEAIEASENGDSAAAEYAMAEAEILEGAAVVGAVRNPSVKADGVGASMSWEITEIDPSKVPISFDGMELRPVDEKIVLQLIKKSKGKIQIPGIAYKETAVISIRT